MTIIEKGCDPRNYTPGRSSRISGIVVHLMDGSMAGTDAWFRDSRAHVSAHYGISKTGEIHQYVQDSDTAWAQGVPTYMLDPNYHGADKPTWAGLKPWTNPNAYLLSIEHEGKVTDAWTPAMLAASAWLIATKAKQYGFPIDRLHVAGHHEIYAGHSCPGPLCDLDALIAMAQSAGRAL